MTEDNKAAPIPAGDAAPVAGINVAVVDVVPDHTTDDPADKP